MFLSSKKKSWSSSIITSFAFLLIFSLSGCSRDRDKSEDTGTDQQTQEETDNQNPSGTNDTATDSDSDSQTQEGSDNQNPSGTNDTATDSDSNSQTQDNTDNQNTSGSNDTATDSGSDSQTQDGTDNHDQSDNNDASNNSDSDSQEQICTDNRSPIAKISAVNSATSGQTVTLNGSGSSDPDGDTLSYKWIQTGGQMIELSNSSSSNLTFVAPVVSQTTGFTFQLTVHDGKLSNSASVSIEISPVADDKPPMIVSRSPQPDMGGVPTTMEIRAGFNETLLEDSIDTDSVLVMQNGNEVPGIVSYEAESNSVTFKPTSDLSYSATYTVIIANTIKDLSGNAFEGDDWSFTTVSCDDPVEDSNASDATNTTDNTDTSDNTNTDAISDSECDMSELLAFPCAEGYGKHTTGGRGGEVYEVTNLNSSGAGSLGDALSKSGRTVVFRISGTIKGRFDVPENTTIAGQTAPGDGIAIYGQLGLDSNVIIRYIRVRFDGEGDQDAIGERYSKNIILDHVTGSWSRDEVMSIYHNEDVTIQWSMVTQACPNSGTESHRFGGIWGNERSSYHHNLIANNENRNPRWASGCGFNDYRNNVIYNWGYGSSNGGEAHQVGDRRNPPIEHSTINMVANYYKAGPGTSANGRIISASTRNGDADAGNFHLSKNIMVGNDGVTNDNWKGASGTYHKLDTPWDAMPINEQSAEAAYEAVLADVGCTKPARDSLDATIIENVRNGTATIGKNGFISCPSDANLPTLNSTPAPADSDHDGMPDDWETANGLDPNNAEDRNQTYGPGYTMLEKYLNSLDSF